MKRVIEIRLVAILLLIGLASVVPTIPTPVAIATAQTVTMSGESSDVFSIGKAYAGSGSDKITETGENSFEIVGKTETGETIPSITIPIEFYNSTEDVTYNFYCSGTEGYQFFAESQLDEYDPEDWINLENGAVSFGSYFGYWTAEPFILSNKGDFGTHIDYVGKGKVRILLFLWGFPDDDLKLDCKFNVVSNDPPFRKTTTLSLNHVMHKSTPAPIGYIRVWSKSGVDIYLDNVYQGVIGSDWFWIYNVSTGYHTIRLEKSGYEDYTETVYVSAGDTAAVSTDLTATPTPTTVATSIPTPTGCIRVWSSPSGADIYLDGVYQGITCLNWFWIYEVSAEYHTIRLEKSGYDDYTETVYVSAGTTSVSYAGSVYAVHAASIDATLTQETGSISVSSAPSGADIYLDGAYKGATPTTIPDVIPGSHALKLEKYGYAEWLTSVHVTSGATESIIVHLTAADIAPPAIRIDKPATIDQNNNGLLEEGEKVTITYGASDPGGVASIKILLDGTTLESQNRAGTYTVTTSPLSVGTHTIRVVATDSKLNSGFEELPITVERAGPSVYFGTARTAINKGEDAIFTLSAVNSIGNPPMTVQLILKPPSGVSVTSSSFAKAGAGIYTCTQTIKPGDNVRSIEVRLTGNQIGTHKIASEVYYQFEGSPKSPTRYETLTLIVEPGYAPAPTDTPTKVEMRIPGFGSIYALCMLLFVWRYRRGDADG
ncbi:MAG: PEGA domain-containing protein [Methanosarcinales archaeon]|nr:MAG: PEGA domain-containing protein [Methanosarcinales archaeon]